MADIAAASYRISTIDDAADYGGIGVRLMRIGAIALYYSLAIVFIWIGLMKFTDYEAAGIAGFVINSPDRRLVARAARHRRHVLHAGRL